MKVLILGAGGMAGHVVAIRLAELGHEVTGFARKKLSFCDTVVADARDIEELNILRDYDIVINCIGVLNKAVDNEPYGGIWLNACLPHLLVELTKDTSTKIVHISTDCVFSGREGGGYTENAYKSADSLYARSKALGEIDDNKNLTFRMSIVGPDINRNGIGLFSWFINQSGTVNGYTKAIWTGVTTITLADAIDAAIRKDLSGLYHLVNNKTISKFELLKLFNTLRCNPIEIVPSDAVVENKSLVNTRTDFNFAVPNYTDMVREMGEWIKAHSELYPQYYNITEALR
jgi:dTDP-4-dehydrorhamnose reductase